MSEGGGQRRLNRDDGVLVLAGAALMVATWTLLRQTKLAIQSLERAMLINALSYFAGISVGYLVAYRLSREFVRGALLVLAVLQVVLGLTLQTLALELSRVLPAVGVELAIFALVSIASTTLFAVFLPAISAERDGDLTWCYVIEVAGSLGGLLALAWLADAGQSAIYGLQGALALAMAGLLGARPLPLALAAGTLAALVLGHDAADRWLATRCYQKRNPAWQVNAVAYQRYTPYQKIEILETRQGRRLVLDGRSHASARTFENYAYFAAEYPASLVARPRVCVLGCGSMATVGRIGARAAAIDIVDIDRGVFETSRVFFEELHHASRLGNWTFHHDDAKHWLANGTSTYDLIVHDIPPARTRQTALTYTAEFFEIVKARLAPGGIFSLPSLVSVHARSAYGRKIVRTMGAVFEHVWVLQFGHGSYLFGSDRVLRRPEELIRSIAHPAANRVQLIAGSQIAELSVGQPVVRIGALSELIDE